MENVVNKSQPSNRLLSHPLALLTLIIVCLTTLVGCQRQPAISFVAAQGSVRLDGADLESGTIDFFPMPGTPGSAASMKIINGRFATPSDAKLQPGKFRVEISAYRTQGTQQITDAATGKMTNIENLVQIIPPRYNKSSELTADLVADTVNELKYDLKTP